MVTTRGLGVAVALLSVVGLVWLAGCQKKQTTRARTTEVEQQEQPAAREGPGMVHFAQYWPNNSKEGGVLLVEKTAPQQVRTNQAFQYEMKVTNVSNSELRNVMISDSVPGQVKINQSTPNADLSHQGWARWNVGTLRPGESKTIQVQALATGTENVQICTEASYQIAPACVCISVVNPALALTVQTPSQQTICEPVPVTYTVKNPGTGTASNVVIRDQLPEGLQTMDQKNALVMDAGNLQPGESKQVLVRLRATRTGTYSHEAQAAADGGLQARAGSTVNIVQPQLAVQVAGPKTRYIDAPITYTLTVTNGPPAVAQDSVLTYNVPAGSTFIGASDNGTFKDGRVTWSLGTLQPNDSRKVTVTIRSPQAGTIRNDAAVTAVCGQAAACMNTNITGISALTVCATPCPDPVRVGAQTTYTITINSTGSAADSNVQLRLTLPQEMQYIASDGPSKGTASGQEITFAPLNSVGPGQSVVYKVTVKALKANDVRLRMSLTSNGLRAGPVESQQSTNIYE